MQFVKLGLGCLLAGVAVAVLSAQEAPPAGAPARAGGPAGQVVWAPKAVKLNDWVAPHKPHTKLADVLAKHKGQTDWTELIADDDNLHAAYISTARVGKLPAG